MSTRRLNNAIKKAYSDIKNSPVAFTSKRNVLREVKKTVKSATLKDVTNYLQGIDSYTLHRSSRKSFQTRKFLSQGINYEWQADLIILSSKHAKLNKSKYLLSVIDVFSRKLSCLPLKKKTNEEIIRKFSKIIKQRGKPKILLTDSGSEFTGKRMRQYLRQKRIKFYVSHNPWHAGIIERCQKTLKQRIFKYLTHYNTDIFIPKLQYFVRAYNLTPHRALPNKMTPADVNKSNEELVWKFQYSKILRKASSPKLKVGQIVRITRHPEIFRKGYQTRFTKEKFLIKYAYPSIPATYRIVSKEKGDMIQGLFYEPELQPVR